ncbi:MAG: type I pullulanase [Erysipelotrichaceae bacterium]
MRKKSNFEAYLDDFHTIGAYLSVSFYQGKSNAFYIRYPDGSLESLRIASKVNINNSYVKYKLQVERALDFHEQYEIIEEHALSTPLQKGMIVKTAEFDRAFTYLGDDLGARYTAEATTFALWAPISNDVVIQLEHQGNIRYISMHPDKQGVFRATVKDDLDGALYVYLVNVNGQWREVCDPYALTGNANARKSMVVNPAKVEVDLYNNDLPPLSSKTDAILYETHIRDFSSMYHGLLPEAGTFKGMMVQGKKVQDKPVLFDHLLKLGVTHVQLQPVHDFATVDEYNTRKFYNWGYDPLSYYGLEGSYSSNPEDGYTRIVEFKQLIGKMHQYGLRVVLDLVYNHYYDFNSSPLQNIVPNYFFQMDKEANLSNGSFCGNDYDTTRAMARKYVVDSCKNWVETFGVDGIRFDLMGIMDLETVREIERVCREIKPDFMVYGEGWHMPTMLEGDLQANMGNYHKMPEISFFNDYYRDVLKGSTMEDEMAKKGYATGDASLYGKVISAVAGTCSSKFGEVKFLNPTQSINYVECHDNATLWDKMRECCKEDVREERILRQKLISGVILISQGIPFLHSGQEFARTKYGVSNSYRSNDDINMMDWNRCARNYCTVEYLTDMIKLRKHYHCLRFQTREQVEKHVSFEEIQPGMIRYKLTDIKAYDEIEELEFLINTTKQPLTYEYAQQVKIVCNEAGYMPQGIRSHIVTVNPLTIVGVEK